MIGDWQLPLKRVHNEPLCHTVEEFMMQMQHINAQSIAVRVVLLLVVLGAVTGAWVAGRWYLANVFAEIVPGTGEKGRATLLWAQGAGPRDPLTHRALGGLDRRSLDPEANRRAVGRDEEAARLSPFDYRIWIDLGQARQQAEDGAGAEKAFRRARSLRRRVCTLPQWRFRRCGGGLLRARRERHREPHAGRALRPTA